jgi:hypothetical protein
VLRHENAVLQLSGPASWHRRHWAEHTYGVFLPKHRVGNPGGYTEYFQQHPDGTYRLIK